MMPAGSLVRRLTLGAAAVVALSFLAQAAVVALLVRPLAADDMRGMGQQAMVLQAALATVPPSQRAVLADQLRARNLQLQTQAPQDGRPETDIPTAFAEQAAWLNWHGIALDLRHLGDGRSMAVFELPVDGQRWWFSRPMPAHNDALVVSVWLWLALLAIGTLGGLWMSVRLVARPLAQVASALKAQGAQLRPLPADLARGSTELRELVGAFNALADQIDRADRARQQLLAGVSHDLRTPLARLQLRVETEAEGELAQRLDADLRLLERIVDQFLAYVQGGRPASAATWAPVHQTLHDALAELAGERDDLRLDLAALPLQLPDRVVRSIATNLVDNAFAHGRPPVRVSWRAWGDRGGELVVADDGYGLTTEQFEQALEPFVRLATTRAELGHCGLGLPIVHQLAAQTGATLQVHPRATDGREPFAVIVRWTGTEASV